MILSGPEISSNLLATDVIFPSGSPDGVTGCANTLILDNSALEGNETFIVEVRTSDLNILIIGQRPGDFATRITIEDNDG